MSGLPWITLHSWLQKGVTLINNLNPKKYELLLIHIINSTTEEFFTENELRKLQTTLKLDENQLQLLLRTLVYVYKQSSKLVLKPTDLQKQLTENIGFDPEKAEVFVKEWSSETNKVLGAFENRDLLKNMQWELNLQVGSDMGTKQALPNARIQLDLCKVNNEQKSDKVVLELGEDDLQELYNTLEIIQLKLDNISKKS